LEGTEWLHRAAPGRLAGAGGKYPDHHWEHRG
jgi:hypothetical protein